MSDKKILSESTVRRFMKLARVDALSENFISENFNEEEINEEEEVELEENIEDLEEQEEDPLADEEPMDAEDAEPEMAMDAPADTGEELGAADMSLTEEEARVLISLGERLAEALGSEEEADDIGDEEMADEEPPVEADAELEAPEAAGPEEDEAAMGGYGARMQESARDEIVQEVLKRVTKRLVSQKLRK